MPLAINHQHGQELVEIINVAIFILLLCCQACRQSIQCNAPPIQKLKHNHHPIWKSLQSKGRLSHAIFHIQYCLHLSTQRKLPRENSWVSKSLKCVVIGKYDKSDSLIFYYPPSKQTFSCGDGYWFDMVSPAGPQFGEQYQGDLFFNTKATVNVIHHPPAHEKNASVFIHTDDAYHKACIIDIPIKE